MNYDKLVNTVADLGYLLIANGAEISRAEESMHRVFFAYGAQESEVFAIPTFLSVCVTTADGHPVTTIRRILSHDVNMSRVELANNLCRRVCRSRPPLDSVGRDIRHILQLPTLSIGVQTAAYACVAAAFTLFYGGDFRDAAVAFLCGAVIRPIWQLLERLRANRFFTYIVASFVPAAMAMVFSHFYVALDYDKVIIGALMNLVPGVAITSFMRDIIAGDMIAGILRFTESVLVAAAIAIGAGIALTATRLLLGV